MQGLTPAIDGVSLAPVLLGESKNVAGEHPEIVERAEALMKNERVPSEDFAFPAFDE